MGGLFSSHSVSSTSPVVASIQLQTSAYGRPITWVFGQQRVAPNLIQYEDFTATPHTTSERTGKGGGRGPSTTDYTYTVAAVMALSTGPVASVGRVWKDKDTTSLAKLNFDFYDGDAQQDPYPYMVTKHPDRAMNYRGIAYVASGAYDLDSSAAFGNHTFEVQASGSIGQRYAGSNVTDAEVVDVVTSILTDIEQGVGLDPSALGDMTAFRNFCLANSLWVSPAYTEQKGAYDYIKNLMTIGFSDCVYSGGKFKVVPYSDVGAAGALATYVPTIAPVYDLGEDDFIGDETTDAIRISQKSADESYNHVRVKFSDRANSYNDNIAESSDDADIELSGMRTMDVVELPEIADAAVAQKVADYILHRSLYILNTYVFKLPWKYVRLEPMDVVTLTYPRKFLDGVPVLITDIEEDETGLLTITAEDYPMGSNKHTGQAPPDTGNSAPNYAIDPGNSNAPLLFEPPGKMTANDSQLWLATSGGLNWGGCIVWASTDNRSYERIGTVRGGAQHGVLAGPLPAGAATDTASTLTVDLSVSRGVLKGATEGNAQDLLTVSYVDGEYIAYANEALVGPHAYKLSYLVRGAYGSDIGAHAAGTPFAFLDGAIFKYSYPHDWVGKTLWIKLTSFNQFGGSLQDLSLVEAYQHTLVGAKVTAAQYLTASAKVFAIELDWGLPADAGEYLQYTEIWFGPTPDLANATKLDSVAAPQNTFTLSGLAAGVKFYFWVRLVDRMGNPAEFYPAGDGVMGMTSTDATDILSYLAGAIGKTQLGQDVLQPIEDAEQIIGPVMDMVDALLHGGQDDDLASTQLLGMISADKALTDARTALNSSIGAVGAAVDTEKEERTTATEALATQINTVAATTDNNTALIMAEQVARTTADEAVASQLTIVAANIGKNEAAIQSELTARATADSALSSRIDSVLAQAVGNTAAILSEQTTRANADGAMSTRIDSVLTLANGNAAAISSESTARSTADSALGKRIDTVTATAGSAQASAQFAQTAVANTNGQLSAMSTIKTQISSNGRTYLAAIGVGVENTGGIVESQILLSAQRVAIIDESTGALQAPFVVQGGQVFINQGFIGTAWITNANIAQLAVSTIQLQGNAVTVPKVQTFNATTSGAGSGNWINVGSVSITLDQPGMVFASATGALSYGQGWVAASTRLQINGQIVSQGGGEEAYVNAAHSGGLFVGAGTVTVELDFYGLDDRVRISNPSIFVMGAKK